MDIFKQIREDHEKQRLLLDELVKTSGASRARKDVYQELKNELKVHADAEERYFYKPLFNDDFTQDEARHGVAEHHEMDELMDEMDNTPMDSPAWMHKAKKLKEMVLHHLDDEEHHFFQKAGKTLADEKKEKLAKNYREMMETELS